MRWRRGRRSENIEDRRGRGAGGLSGFPNLGMGRSARGRRGRKAGGIGIVGLLIILGLSYFLGIDPMVFLQQGAGVQETARTAPPRAPSAKEQELADFVAVVLGDTEDSWHALFREQLDATYREPVLVLFTGSVRSACGLAGAATGPFYCPGDSKVYIDLSFYDDLRRRFKAPGDFAQAYVIAHEVGHHVQNLLGILPKVHEARRSLREAEANRLSVRLELQADCFAGVWAHHADKARNILEKGDVEEALNAASAIGDDRIQKQSRGYVTPDSFTHGTSAQRVRWFRKGLDNGRLAVCDTFNASRI